MSNAASKPSQKGKRYTEAEKQEIVDFVEKYNTENGRGGQSAAAAKYSVSQLTVSGWLKASGSPASSKKSAGKASKGAAKVSAKGGFNAKLSSLLALSQEIEQTEKDLVKLKAKFKALKASL